MENKKLGALAFLPQLPSAARLRSLTCVYTIFQGGSYFGDNLSMISDTTIAAAEGCGSEMRDKFRMNFFIAFPAAVLSMIFYGFIGGAGSGSMEVGAFDLFQIASKRLASLVDIFACASLAVMLHDGGMLMTSEMANISPFAILPYSVYPLFLVIATCVTIQAGLLRTPEEKYREINKNK